MLATQTWQAYNLEDANGDGWGDSWYTNPAEHTVDLTRPFRDFGLPYRFGDWDLAFLTWLQQNGKQVDFLTDADIDKATGDQLAKAYSLVIFPGHEEYVTAHELAAIQRYKALGGNMAFLAANNLFWKVQVDGAKMKKIVPGATSVHLRRRSSARSTPARITARCRRRSSSAARRVDFDAIAAERRPVRQPRAGEEPRRLRARLRRVGERSAGVDVAAEPLNAPGRTVGMSAGGAKLSAWIRRLPRSKAAFRRSPLRLTRPASRLSGLRPSSASQMRRRRTH